MTVLNLPLVCPKRRWFQFSLRTLMIGVTLLAVVCAYIGWQATIMRMRQARVLNLSKILDKANPTNGIPWVRQWLGDRAYAVIAVGETASDKLEREFGTIFPEAKIVRTISNEEYWKFSCD
jgi:hypothetical protein